MLVGCEPSAPASSALLAQEPIARADFVALVDRVSEKGGYFDTDNLISNETGYLNVIDALRSSGLRGGAYVGVGPDQNYSYIAALEPEVAFIVDIRRDNVLQHLLLKALVERAATPVEFLAGLHGVAPPSEPAAWRGRDIEAAVAYVDSMWARRGPAPDARASALEAEVAERIAGYGLDLSDDDYATIRRFHEAFIRAGLGLRFTSFGRPPRPYYPTYGQLVLETDIDGDHASWLASQSAYDVVRSLHLANRIIPVVGDLAGAHAVREIGSVLDESGLQLEAFYVSNVEFYLWQGDTFDRWLENVRALPAADGAVVIRSYFPSFGTPHPSAVPGYYATQSLQPLATLARGGFSSYWDVVTRDVIPLR